MSNTIQPLILQEDAYLILTCTNRIDIIKIKNNTRIKTERKKRLTMTTGPELHTNIFT